MKCEECGQKIKEKSIICNKCGGNPKDWNEWDNIDFAIPYLIKIHKENFTH